MKAVDLNQNETKIPKENFKKTNLNFKWNACQKKAILLIYILKKKQPDFYKQDSRQ